MRSSPDLFRLITNHSAVVCSTTGMIELTLAAGPPVLKDLDSLIIAETKISIPFVSGMLRGLQEQIKFKVNWDFRKLRDKGCQDRGACW